MTHNTKERWLAIAVGACASTAALAILWQDVLMSGARPTLDHFLMIAIVGITIAAGHLAIKGRTLGAFVGFGFVFALGIALTIYTSVGRQAEVADTASRRADVVASERSRIMKLRDRAEAMLQEANGKLAAECKSGKGQRCDGIKATVDVYTAAVKGHNADLSKLPVIITAARSTRFAEVVALTGASATHVQNVAYLTEPFAFSLFFELCAIVAFGFGFGGKRHTEPSARDSMQTSLPSPELFAGDIGGGTTEPKALPNRPRGGSGMPKELAREIIVAELADGKHYGSQDELAERFGRSKSTISEWLKEWEADGVIPERTVRGRCKELVAD